MTRGRKDFEKWSPDTRRGVSAPVGRIEELTGGNHFATRQRANDFARLMRSLPDPDPILQKMGKDITALQGLLADSHMESVWSVRCSVTSGAEWFIASGADGRREKEASEAFSAELAALDIPRIIEEMMDAVAYGYAPLEIIWQAHNGRWSIGDIVGKPPEWFEFDQENKLVFKTGVIGTEPLPENRFLVVRHRSSYANPYGDKVFSKCYWPCVFKRKGQQWWTVFIEKYGGAFLYGTYPDNWGEERRQQLLTSLEVMIADAVAIIPEGSDVHIEALANKGSVSNVHAEYISAANSELSKAVLGQTLTTEIGEKGSYAAAKAHNLVREDLAAADRLRICAAFNRLAAVYTLYNFGEGVIPPKFEFVQDEDLQLERVERDVELYSMGWRPTKTYITREYGIPEEDFDLFDGAVKDAGFNSPEPVSHFNQPVPCTCCHNDKPSLFDFVARLSGKENRSALRDEQLMAEFGDSMLQAGQGEINALVEGFADALGTVDNWEGVSKALAERYGKQPLDGFAHVIDEARFAAQGIGGRKHG
jgi:phage gp29-like protein